MEKQKHLPLAGAGFLCVVALLVMAASLLFGQKQSMRQFIPPAFETSAVNGVPDVPDGLGWNEVDAAIYKVSVCGNLTLKENTVDIWLTNPNSNAVWITLRILDTVGNILGETGLIRPGEYVISVVLNRIPNRGIPVSLKIMAYEPETYHSVGAVLLNTVIQ